MEQDREKSIRIAADRDHLFGVDAYATTQKQQSFQNPQKFKVQHLRSAALALPKNPADCPNELIEQAFDSLTPNLFKAVRAGLNAKDDEGKPKHSTQAEAANVWCRVKMVILAHKKLAMEAQAGLPPSKPEPLLIEMTLKDQTVESIEQARNELRLAAGKNNSDPVRFVIDVPAKVDDANHQA